MKIEITEKELSLILLSLNHTAHTFRDKASELDRLYDRLDLLSIWKNAEPEQVNHEPTAQDKSFFAWLARQG